MIDEAEALAALIALDEPSIRAHLAGPDPTRRLHAAWALGLRARDGGAAAARRLLAAEPHAGVRRHLAVMLGGDLEALGALLELDPSERVRETALHLVAQSWPIDGHVQLAERVLAVAQADPSSDVRLAALDLLGGLAQHVESGALLALVDAQRDTQDARLAWAAIRLAAQRADPSVVHALVTWSVSAGRELRARTWGLLGPPRAILESLRRIRELGREDEVPATLVREALDHCLDDASVPFADVAWVDGLGLDDEILRVVPHEGLPPAWLLARARSVLDDNESWIAWSALRSLARLGEEGRRIEPGSAQELEALSAELEKDEAFSSSAETQDEWEEREAGSTRGDILRGLAALLGRAAPR